MKKIICIFNNMLQKVSSKNPFYETFYEKMKMTKKRIVVLESVVIVGSFDCERTHI